MNITKALVPRLQLISCGALFALVTGCVGYVEGPRRARVYEPRPRVYGHSPVVVQDDYVYYPGYEVYYSSSRRQYVYLEGRSWVTRSSPRVSVDVLLASPSVRMNFHDAPEAHHARVVQQYPKHWAPGGSGRDRDSRERNSGNGRNGERERRE